MGRRTFLCRALALALCLTALTALAAGCGGPIPSPAGSSVPTGTNPAGPPASSAPTEPAATEPAATEPEEAKALGNGIWQWNGMLFREEPSTNPDQLSYGARYYSTLIDTYLKDCHVYCAVIPDKNYYVRGEAGFPVLNYETLLDTFTGGLQGATVVDILDTLTPEDYYLTDNHWRQTELFDTVAALARAMGVEPYLTPREDYAAHTLSPFYGVFARDAETRALSDELVYLTSAYTDSAAVSGPLYDFDTVYVPEKFEGEDGYDIFLGGAQPVIFLENEDAKTDKELYIFRDSFGSSLVPLFLGAYRKITVIDMRYITGAYLPNVVSFTPGSDVLILNSVLTLNTAAIMR